MRPIIAASILLLATVSAAAQQLSFEDAIGRLKLPDLNARMQALSLLEESGYPEAGEPIAALLHDPDDRLQRAAMYAELGIFLGTRIELRRKVALVVEVRDSRPAERLFDTPWSSLPVARVPDAVLTAMLGPIRHQDPVFRMEAVYALGLLAQLDGGSPTPAYKQVAETLAERLGEPDPVMRAAVARAAGRIFLRGGAPPDMPGVSRLGDALVHTLNDPDRRVRLAAMGALGDMRWERGVQALTDGYNYLGGKGDALYCLATLARIAHPSSAPLLKPALVHREASYRLVAGEGMARVGGAEAIAASAALAADRNAAVRLAAAFASARSGQAAGVDQLVSGIDAPTTRQQSQEYLMEVGEAAAPAVVAALAKGDAPRRIALLEVLGTIGRKDDLAGVEGFQREPNAALAMAAERAALRIRARTQ